MQHIAFGESDVAYSPQKALSTVIATHQIATALRRRNTFAPNQQNKLYNVEDHRDQL